jgi:hypothetical protein
MTRKYYCWRTPLKHCIDIKHILKINRLLWYSYLQGNCNIKPFSLEVRMILCIVLPQYFTRGEFQNGYSPLSA